jgi:hypothetical protein
VGPAGWAAALARREEPWSEDILRGTAAAAHSCALRRGPWDLTTCTIFGGVVGERSRV